MHDLLAIFKANQSLPGAPRWTDQQFLEECQNQNVLVSKDGGLAQAFILYRSTPEALEISYLATSPQAKRKGLMRTLLGEVRALAKSANVSIWLEVHESNAEAIALYEAFGFRRTGKRPMYYADGASALLYNYG